MQEITPILSDIVTTTITGQFMQQKQIVAIANNYYVIHILLITEVSQ